MKVCRCGQPQEPGFCLDRGRTDIYPTAWHPGAPQPRQDRFLGFNLADAEAVQIDQSRLYTVVTYRCQGCGLLESYAE